MTSLEYQDAMLEILKRTTHTDPPDRPPRGKSPHRQSDSPSRSDRPPRGRGGAQRPHSPRGRGGRAPPAPMVSELSFDLPVRMNGSHVRFWVHKDNSLVGALPGSIARAKRLEMDDDLAVYGVALTMNDGTSQHLYDMACCRDVEWEHGREIGIQKYPVIEVYCSFSQSERKERRLIKSGLKVRDAGAWVECSNRGWRPIERRDFTVVVDERELDPEKTLEEENVQDDDELTFTLIPKESDEPELITILCFSENADSRPDELRFPSDTPLREVRSGFCDLRKDSPPAYDFAMFTVNDVEELPLENSRMTAKEIVSQQIIFRQLGGAATARGKQVTVFSEQFGTKHRLDLECGTKIGEIVTIFEERTGFQHDPVSVYLGKRQLPSDARIEDCEIPAAGQLVLGPHLEERVDTKYQWKRALDDDVAECIRVLQESKCPSLMRVVTVSETREGDDPVVTVVTEPIPDERLDPNGEFNRDLVIFGIAKAIAYLHANAIVLNTLTMRDIRLNARGEPIVVGFANVQKYSEEEGDLPELRDRPELIAPELDAEVGFGPAVDIWAFGKIIEALIPKNSPHRPLLEQCVKPNPDDRPLIQEVVDRVSEAVRGTPYAATFDRE
jgi:hypothetical protein